MQRDAMLKQLGYVPNEALLEQMGRIIDNTTEYSKIEKHIIDLSDVLKVDKSYIAMSNSEDYLKIKIEAEGDAMIADANQKVEHFSDKFKVALKKVGSKNNTYYILGFDK
ncbi:MAG: type I secretion C-terminal target domain-containing protein [Campylobacterota bacterium]|nr:type I secretion C-terminal target domain-containing protein [Campylobacterota bacterium]